VFQTVWCCAIATYSRENRRAIGTSAAASIAISVHASNLHETWSMRVKEQSILNLEQGEGCGILLSFAASTCNNISPTCRCCQPQTSSRSRGSAQRIVWSIPLLAVPEPSHSNHSVACLPAPRSAAVLSEDVRVIRVPRSSSRTTTDYSARTSGRAGSLRSGG